MVKELLKHNPNLYITRGIFNKKTVFNDATDDLQSGYLDLLKEQAKEFPKMTKKGFK